MDKRILNLLIIYDDNKDYQKGLAEFERVISERNLSNQDEALAYAIGTACSFRLNDYNRTIKLGDVAFSKIDSIENDESGVKVKRDLCIDLINSYYELYKETKKDEYSVKLKRYSNHLLKLHNDYEIFSDESSIQKDIKFANLILEYLKNENKDEETNIKRKESGIQWVNVARGRHEFNALVEINDQLKAHDFGIGCIRCNVANPLMPCPNCGSEVFQFGVNKENYIGIFCSSCNKGFTSFKCRECDTENPINHETVIKKKKGGYFIVTAACGDVNAPEVLFLTYFRDSTLARYPAGRIFIQIYYSISPKLARVISQSNYLQKTIRLFLIRPTISLLRILRVNK